MSDLPSYVAAAKPVPLANRAPWYKNTAQTYAGIMLWFVFWTGVPAGVALAPGSPYSAFAGGTLAQGIGVALGSLVLAALLCHFLFYLVPGMLGMKTGLPLYIVGTSTYGVRGGFLMPGFLMGVLQFGWLGVNAYFSALALSEPLGFGPGSAVHRTVIVLFALAAAFVGLKGIQYVARVATFLPIIPLVILAVLFVSTFGGVKKFDPKPLVAAGEAKIAEVKKAEVKKTDSVEAKIEAVGEKSTLLSTWGVIAVMCTYVVGFFATAGAAGCDFGMNNRDTRDVQLGGLVGVAGATIFAGGLALLIVAGAHGLGKAGDPAAVDATSLIKSIMGDTRGGIFKYLLAIAAFPPACASSFIAANSFKTTLPRVNPFISCGIGTLVAILLGIMGWAGDAAGVFTIIGASFGPVCGAMAADYLLAGRKWSGPRAGFNPAGWISWILGFAVGAADFIPGMVKIPCPPVAAFIVGFVLYLVLSAIGLRSRTLDMPAVAK